MRLLTLNSGSSSIKAALYELAVAETMLLDVDVMRIGLPGSDIRIRDAGGQTLLDHAGDQANHDDALQTLFDWLKRREGYNKLDAIGHRVVHGGSRYSQPELITPELVETLQELVPIDPNHLPAAISGIRAVSKLYPSLPQVACFDTAFHRHMPRVAQMYALPRKLFDEGVLRYGFHGLSYEYITQELQRLNGSLNGRLIVAHLGNGASIAAIRDGVGVDTSMGFTPVCGLVMGTRCGDVDPGILLHLVQDKGMSAEAVNELINKQSGLLGASGISADMKDLLDKATSDPRAAEAIDLFCYQVKKYIGAYAAALGGLDTLAFTAGIGENAAPIRARICDGLEFLGIQLDTKRNVAHAPVISPDGSRVTVRVIKTNEDLVIARHVHRLVSKGAPKRNGDE